MTDFAARPGDFCWFELATTDQAGAKRFYESLFGWTSADMPIGPTELYTIFRLGGRDAGAAYNAPRIAEHRGCRPTGCHASSSRMRTRGRARDEARRHGERAAVRRDGVGTHERHRHPLGAVFAVWQAKQHVGVGVKDEPGSVSWADLQVRDQVKAGAFYSSLFGWTMVEGGSMDPAKPGDYYHIVNGETMIGGIPPAGQVDPKAHPAWLMYVEVAECASSTRKAVSLGGRAYVDTTEIGKEGRISVIADAQGAVLAPHQSQR